MRISFYSQLQPAALSRDIIITCTDLKLTKLKDAMCRQIQEYKKTAIPSRAIVSTAVTITTSYLVRRIACTDLYKTHLVASAWN